VKSNTANFDKIPLFLHIPKTGGTTLTNCIFDQHEADENYESEEGYLVNGIYYYPDGFHKSPDPVVPAGVKLALGRRDIRAVVGHFSFGIHQYVNRPWTYVTLLRNPVDRVLSLYYHIRRYEDAEFHEVVSGGLSIEDFVLHLSCKEADNDQTRRISGLEPEFGACSISTLDRAKDNLRRYFSVAGVTECFDETVVLIKRTLGWVHEPYYLPGLVNKDRPASVSLPQKSLNAILERNELDTQLYDFAKALFHERISGQGPDFNSQITKFKALNAEYITKYGPPN
jgi:hypothetical protein